MPDTVRGYVSICYYRWSCYLKPPRGPILALSTPQHLRPDQAPTKGQLKPVLSDTDRAELSPSYRSHVQSFGGKLCQMTGWSDPTSLMVNSNPGLPWLQSPASPWNLRIQNKQQLLPVTRLNGSPHTKVSLSSLPPNPCLACIN